METKMQILADKMNELFPHLNAHVDDGGITFRVSILDNGTGKRFEDAIQVYLFPKYENHPMYYNDRDHADTVATIYNAKEYIPEEMTFAINPEEFLF